MAYSVKVINCGVFGDSEQWVHLQALDEEGYVVREEIWTREETSPWEMKDCLVGEEEDPGT